MDQALKTIFLEDPWTKVALEWLANNQPSVLRLMPTEDLAEHLMEKVQQARTLHYDLKEQGMEPWQTEEMAMAILAPPPEENDPDESPQELNQNPVEGSELNKIWEALKSVPVET